MFKSTIAVIGFFLAGCAATVTPNYNAKFGDAVRDAKLRMTINPNAGLSTDNVAGIDGKAAKEAVGRYHGTFKEPPPAVNVINIGGAIGGGG